MSSEEPVVESEESEEGKIIFFLWTYFSYLELKRIGEMANYQM